MGQAVHLLHISWWFVTFPDDSEWADKAGNKHVIRRQEERRHTLPLNQVSLSSSAKAMYQADAAVQTPKYPAACEHVT